MPLDVLHLEVGAAGVGWKQACCVALLVLVLLVEDKHLEKVLAMDQLMLELFRLEEFCL